MHLTKHKEQDPIPEPAKYQRARRLNRETRQRKRAQDEQQQQQRQQQQHVPSIPRPLDAALVPVSRRDHRLIDAKEINELLEACLDRRNVPEDQRRTMLTQPDEVKMAYIRQCWADMSKQQQPQAAAPMPTLLVNRQGAVIAIPGDGSGSSSSKTSSSKITTVHNHKYTVNNNSNSNSTVSHYDTVGGVGNPSAETVTLTAAATPALLPPSSSSSPPSTGTGVLASSWNLAAAAGYWLLCWGPYLAGAFGLVWLHMSITSWTAAVGASLARAAALIPSLPSLPSWLSTSSSSSSSMMPYSVRNTQSNPSKRFPSRLGLMAAGWGCCFPRAVIVGDVISAVIAFARDVSPRRA
ncbi:hypothetical protein LY76DRAFT_651497 [Colletotrichum caudatum]|nr:hypothetical protein LY76DRAFT_651497 [Colletotrichum caudatum]